MAFWRSLRVKFHLQHSNYTSKLYQTVKLTRNSAWCPDVLRYCTKASISPVANNVLDPNDYDSPKDFYDARVKTGELYRDSHQVALIDELQRLHKEVNNYEPVSTSSGGFLSKIFGSSSKQNVPGKVPKGLYLYGSVGCGKTMIMDIFHQTCNIEKKHRTHFHAFMLDVHKKIHAQKEKVPRQPSVRGRSPFDPIPPVAREIAAENWLLCFDEFQVTDIADAMILRRLFDYLWRNGVVIIATSNRHPDDLYKNGLQRIHFLPFIPMLKDHADIHCLDSGIDYRMMTMPAEGKIYYVISHEGPDATTRLLDRIFDELASEQKAEIGPKTMTVLGRQVTFPKTCAKILDASFKDLCMKPLGAVDYLEICNQFDTLILRDIPSMNLERKVEARRFITLIDTIYDQKIQLICSAEAVPQGLFDTVTKNTDGQKHFARVLIGDLDITVGSENERASLFTGEEELFAFERVVSRLTEMQTEEYWQERERFKKKQEKIKQKRLKKAAAAAAVAEGKEMTLS